MLLRDSIHSVIKQEIISGELSAGDQLNEAEIARRFETSKTPAREALTRLAQEGLLTVLPRIGYIVTVTTAEQAQAIFDFRAILEGAAAELAAHYATEGELRQLKQICELDYQAEKAASYADFFDRNRRFHLLVATASRNPLLVDALEHLFDQINRLLHRRLENATGGEQMAADHRLVVDALSSRDPAGARAAMLTGLDRTRDAVLATLLHGD